MGAIAEDLTRLCREAAPDAHVQAVLANVFVREGLYLDALEAYRSAAQLEPLFAEAHLAASELAYILRDEETSAAHRAAALSISRVFPDPLPVAGRLPLLLLLRDAPYAVNAPLELLLDRSRIAIHKLYVAGDGEPTLPAFACAFPAFGYAGDGAAAAAQAFLERTGAAHVNDPSRFALQARERLPQTLAGIPNVAVVATQRLPRARLAVGPQPLLVRPADSQAGEGLALIDSAEAL